jgi:hypothetical protein
VGGCPLTIFPPPSPFFSDVTLRRAKKGELKSTKVRTMSQFFSSKGKTRRISPGHFRLSNPSKSPRSFSSSQQPTFSPPLAFLSKIFFQVLSFYA